MFSDGVTLTEKRLRNQKRLHIEVLRDKIKEAANEAHKLIHSGNPTIDAEQQGALLTVWNKLVDISDKLYYERVL